MSRLLSIKVGQNLPDQRSLPVIADLAERIDSLEGTNWGQISDISDLLDYQNFFGILKAKLIFREQFWQRYIYPKLLINSKLCVLCGQCAKICPVQRLEITDHVLTIANQPDCIHCGECIHACPKKAISFQCELQKWEVLFAKAAPRKGSHAEP